MWGPVGVSVCVPCGELNEKYKVMQQNIIAHRSNIIFTHFMHCHDPQCKCSTAAVHRSGQRTERYMFIYSIYLYMCALRSLRKWVDKKIGAIHDLRIVKKM